MSAIDAIRNSPLVDETGYVAVNKQTLQVRKQDDEKLISMLNKLVN